MSIEGNIELIRNKHFRFIEKPENANTVNLLFLHASGDSEKTISEKLQPIIKSVSEAIKENTSLHQNIIFSSEKIETMKANSGSVLLDEVYSYNPKKELFLNNSATIVIGLRSTTSLYSNPLRLDNEIIKGVIGHELMHTPFRRHMSSFSSEDSYAQQYIADACAAKLFGAESVIKALKDMPTAPWYSEVGNIFGHPDNKARIEALEKAAFEKPVSMIFEEIGKKAAVGEIKSLVNALNPKTEMDYIVRG